MILSYSSRKCIILLLDVKKIVCTKNTENLITLSTETLYSDKKLLLILCNIGKTPEFTESSKFPLSSAFKTF